MKKIYSFSIVAALFFAACGSANSNKAEVNTVINAADAMKDSANYTSVEWMDPIVQDIGNIKKGQKVEIVYRIKNTGDKPLIIESVNPGCGCTVAGKPEKPILPGKEDKIIAAFDTQSQAVGSFNKQVTVKANTKPQTDAVLSFTGTISE